ncbi:MULTISPECIES: DNA primase [Asaia]|uniref:DNA primase n=1 Tax=Asaia bogorensis TaxID=91915 RepID=A0A060QCT9_9PROT|nr:MULTISPECIES: DNA primase [Asaia]ETC99605.1 DNA primase [Asaia sp. SF2.1]CDG38513.1 DNA primase [Asaia bogorensis]
MAFDPGFLDELRARTPIAAVIGRRTKLSRSGRNWKACCPFHGEKTPSFYVYDDHFHCFGCGVHGDVISFVMQSEGRSFPEAVEQLANEAGLDMPRQDPWQEARSREARSLGDVLEAVQNVYRQALYAPEGRQALSYLRRRGLTEATIERFGLGWAGEGRGALLQALRGQDITAEQLLQAGLMRVDEHGAPRGELFFSRVMFPIRDRRGRLISFGGRTLGDAQPKYVNGPETTLFSKRRALYNLDQARNALRDPAQKLVVAEGYMDVIALAQAGFEAAVAPLGTAMGVEQLELLWREASHPILCLDGDAAGARAALRVAELALPLLTPERSLQFCRLDPKDDPDSLIRRDGPQAMRQVLDGATSLADELFQLMQAGVKQDVPEQRAALKKRLEASAALVADRDLAAEYRRALMERFFASSRRGKGRSGPSRPDSGKSRVRNIAVGDGAGERLRVLTVLVLRHPSILPQIEDPYGRLDLPHPLDEIRDTILDWFAEIGSSDLLTEQNALAALDHEGLGDEARQLIARGVVPSAQAETGGLFNQAPLQQWWHFFGLVNFPAFMREVEQDMQAALANPALEGLPEALMVRLRTLERLRRGEEGDDAD